MPSRTLIDSLLLESCRIAAADPDDQIFIWLRDGAPTGITAQLHDPGLFPECSRPADVQPQDLHCDEQQFRNYPGVEEQDITDAELAAHLKKGHIVAFDTHAKLAQFVESDKPILNKLILSLDVGSMFCRQGKSTSISQSSLSSVMIFQN